jgi:bifunctional DNA primase/polymerase-like protein
MMTGWQDFEATAAELPRLFGGNENIGVVLGSKSGHLVDLDLDCCEAIALVDLYLPMTGAVFGRRSKPRSHRLFIAPGAVYQSYADPISGSTLLEIRADGREDCDRQKGAHQTLFPPSIADGEQREWCGDVIAPRLIESNALHLAAAWLAVGCLIARHISDYAAHRPDDDLVALLEEFDVLEGHGGKLVAAACHWLGIPRERETPQPRWHPRPKRRRGHHPDLGELVDAPE